MFRGHLGLHICQPHAAALVQPPWREGPLFSWKHLLSPWSSRNTSLLPALLSSDWGFNILSGGRSDRATHDKVIGSLLWKGISIFQQEENMSDMGFPYLHTDQDLIHSRDLAHIQWLSGYVLGHNSWRQLSYTNPHVWLGCCFLELCLARAASLSVSGLGGFLWSDGTRAGWRVCWRGYGQGWPQPGSSNPWLRALHCTTAPFSVLRCTAVSLLQLA